MRRHSLLVLCGRKSFNTEFTESVRVLGVEPFEAQRTQK